MLYDIVGDLHSCFIDFKRLLEKLNYREENRFIHPDGRKVVLVGDIFDRGWYPALTFHMVKNMKESGSLVLTKGNHDDKLERWAKGNNVQLLHGLDATIKEFEKANITKEQVLDLFNSIPYFLNLDDNRLIVVHAAWKDKYIDRDPMNKKLRSYCIFGPTTGREIGGFPERIDWASERSISKDSPLVIHGHQPVHEIRKINKVWNIDTGCTFGGMLTAIRYPEMEIVQVSAAHKYYYHEGW
jgi:protein phosphatase